MTRDCLNILINDIQCKYKELGWEASEKASKASRDSDCKHRDMKIVNGALRRLYYYVPFESELTYLKKFTFIRTDNDQLTIEIDIAGVVFSHTGSGDARTFAKEFYKQIENNTQTPNYRAEFDDNILYIYSYDTNTNFNVNTVVNVIQSSSRDNSVKTEDLEDKTHELLDLWNCLSKQGMCKIVNGAYRLLPKEC